jgi:gas vesicle protein
MTAPDIGMTAPVSGTCACPVRRGTPPAQSGRGIIRRVSGETWALVGVVVGAILGGASQLLNDILKARRESHSKRAAIRRDVYARFIVTASESGTAMSNMQRGGETPAGDSLITEALARNDAALAALAEVRIVAPDDTYEAAEEWAAWSIPDMAQPSPRTYENRTTARDKFLALAKRDALPS